MEKQQIHAEILRAILENRRDLPVLEAIRFANDAMKSIFGDHK